MTKSEKIVLERIKKEEKEKSNADKMLEKIGYKKNVISLGTFDTYIEYKREYENFQELIHFNLLEGRYFVSKYAKIKKDKKWDKLGYYEAEEIKALYEKFKELGMLTK